VAKTGKRSAIVRPIGTDTTINGQAAGQWFGDITRGYDVKLNGGDDTLELIGVDARKGLRVEGGDGDDNLSLIDVRSRKDTDILGGAGDDTLTVSDARFHSRAAVDLGDGDDRVNQRKVKYARDTTISGGGGTNTIGSIATTYPSDVVVDGFTTKVSTLLPVAVDDSTSVPVNGVVNIAAAFNDQAPGSTLDPTSYTVTTQPTKGRVTANGDGSFAYTNTGGSGTDTFRYTFKNVAGAVSNEATVTVNLTGRDTDVPTATVSSSSSASSISPILFTVTFSENVTGFEQSDVTVTNGTIASFTSTNGSLYSVNVAPTADGPVTVTVPAGVAQDSAGNQNTAGSFSVNSIRTDAGMVATTNPPASTDPNWVATGTGLSTWDIQTGTGDAIQASSSITVFYTGWLASDGTVFDSRRSPNTPVTFQLSGLIQGWQEGLLGMRPGGIRRLLVPPALGYGTAGSPPNIPPNATLIFEIKLASVS
jgi:hypothetical protein